MFIVRSLAVVMTTLIVLSLTACHKESEEVKIKVMIAAIQKAAGEKDAGTILSHLSRTYHDPQGNDYNGVKGLLLFYFMKHRAVHVYVPSLDISVDNNAARASFQAVLSGSGGALAGTDRGPLPEALGAYEFTVAVQKESGAWKITSAKWDLMGDGPLPKE